MRAWVWQRPAESRSHPYAPCQSSIFSLPWTPFYFWTGYISFCFPSTQQGQLISWTALAKADVIISWFCRLIMVAAWKMVKTLYNHREGTGYCIRASKGFSLLAFVGGFSDTNFTARLWKLLDILQRRAWQNWAKRDLLIIFSFDSLLYDIQPSTVIKELIKYKIAGTPRCNGLSFKRGILLVEFEEFKSVI